VENVDSFNDLYNTWIKEQKQRQKQSHGKHKKGDTLKMEKGKDKEVDKRKAYCLYVMAQLYHGDEVIAEDLHTNAILYSNNPLWNEWLVTSMKMKDIPRVGFPVI
jgi:hypothetical protein